MATEAGLTPEEFATLERIGAGNVPYCGPVPLAHLGLLLKLDFIRAEGNGYSPTLTGMFRLAQSD